MGQNSSADWGIHQRCYNRPIAEDNSRPTDLLRVNDFVDIISVDFTKAFDQIRHHALSQKFLLLDLPDHIHNWVMDCFKGRGHSTMAAEISSLIAWINASIIQGSGIGPPSYAGAKPHFKNGG